MKKVLAILLAAMMLVALLAGCAENGTTDKDNKGEVVDNKPSDSDKTDKTDTPDDGKDTEGESTGYIAPVVNYAQSRDISSFDPFLESGVGGRGTITTIYEALCNYCEDGVNIYGVIAKEWEQTDDVTVRVTIYDYVYDSQGNHITAEDVKFSIDQGFERNTGRVGNADGAEVVSDYVVDVHFRDTIGVSDIASAFTNCYIVSKAAYEASADNMYKTPVGTGRYVLKEYTPDYMWSFEKRDEYWQKEDLIQLRQQANCQTLNVYVVKETAQRVVALQNGTADAVQNITSSDTVYFKEGGENHEGFTLYNVKLHTTFNLCFNTNEASACGDLRVRQAIAYLLDTPVISQALNGEGAATPNCLGGEQWLGYQEAWENDDYYAYNKDKAIELLKDAGYLDGKTLELYMIGSPEPMRGNTALMVQAALNSVEGINCEVANSIDSATMKEIRPDPTKWDIILYGDMVSGSIIDYWADYFNTAITTHGGTMGFINDDNLQKMLADYALKDNFTPENLTTLNNYINDNLYLYAVVFGYDFVVTADWVHPVFDADGAQQIWCGTFDQH